MDGFTSIRRSIEHMKITVQKVIKGVRYLKHYGVKEFFIRLQEKMESENVPYEPWYEHHKATEETLRRQRKQSAAWKGAPRVSIVVPLYCTNETFLREMIGSVQAQSYENWELCWQTEARRKRRCVLRRSFGNVPERIHASVTADWKKSWNCRQYQCGDCNGTRGVDCTFGP